MQMEDVFCSSPVHLDSHAIPSGLDIPKELNPHESSLQSHNGDDTFICGSPHSPLVSESSIFERDVEDLRSGSNISLTNLSSLVGSKRSFSNVALLDQQDCGINTGSCTPIELVKGAEGQGHHFRLSALEDCVSPALDATCSVVTDRKADLNNVNIVCSDSLSSSTYGLGMALGVPRPRSALSFSSRRNPGNNKSSKIPNQGPVSPLSHERACHESRLHPNGETLNFYSYFDMISDEQSSSVISRSGTPMGRSQSSPYYRSASRSYHRNAGVRSSLGNASLRPRSESQSLQSPTARAQRSSPFIIEAPTPLKINRRPRSPGAQQIVIHPPSSKSTSPRRIANSDKTDCICSLGHGGSESDGVQQEDSDNDSMLTFPTKEVKPPVSNRSPAAKSHVFIRSTTPVSKRAVRSSSMSSHFNTPHLHGGHGPTPSLVRSGSALWYGDVIDRPMGIPPHPLHTENLSAVLRRQLSNE